MTSPPRLDPGGPSAAPVVDAHRLLFAALLGTNALIVIASTAAAPTLPELARVFAATPQVDRLIPLVLTLSPLAIALSGPVVGLVLDRWGRRRVLVFGTVLYGLAGASAALAQGLEHILVTRVLLGIAVACLLTGTTTVIADAYGPADRARVLSVQMAIVGVVGTGFVTVSGVLSEVDWRAPFLLYLAALPLVPLVGVAVRDRKPSLSARPVPDGPTVALPEAAASLPLGSEPISVAAPDVTIERRGPRLPSGPLWLLVPTFYLVMGTGQVVNYLAAVHLPFHLELQFGLGGNVAGLAIGLTTLSYALGAAVSAGLGRRCAPVTVGAIAAATIAAGYLAMGYGVASVVLPGAFVSGLGFGFLVPSLLVWLAAVAPERVRGRLFGGMTTALFLGQFLSPLLWQPLIAGMGRGMSFAVAGWSASCVTLFLTGTALHRRWGVRRASSALSGLPSRGRDTDVLWGDGSGC